MIKKILSILLEKDIAKGIRYILRYRRHVDFLKTIYTNMKYFPISDLTKLSEEDRKFVEDVREGKEFVLLYNARNLGRKRTSDLLLAWRGFCDTKPLIQRSVIAVKILLILSYLFPFI